LTGFDGENMKKNSFLINVTIGVAVLLIGSLLLVFNSVGVDLKETSLDSSAELGAFHWPDGKRAAISLSFDDGRNSQIDHCVPLLDQYGIKATFFVSLPLDDSRIAAWKNAVRNGHEIGNHTSRHPCTINYSYNWNTDSIGIEDYTIEMMLSEIEESNTEIERLFEIVPRTFAYPCGQKIIGRGKDSVSYVPLVADHFVVGRGWNDEMPNVPAYCDLSQVMGMPMDNKSFGEIEELLDMVVDKEQWLILVGHEIGKRGDLSTDSSTLRAICEYARNPDKGIWIDTVQAVGSYVFEEQKRLTQRGLKEGPLTE
jgi:peptidoglycan/xylan/chitin deacetylase (PgdA/CDA1 family)